MHGIFFSLAIMSPDLRLSPCGADCFSRMGGRWKPTASTGTAPFTCMKLSPAILVLRMMKKVKSTVLPKYVGDADTGWVQSSTSHILAEASKGCYGRSAAKVNPYE